MRVDFLVAGQGLAGSLVAWELMQRGRSVCVVDDGDPASASRIAAGVINPIVGQRLALNWQVARLMPPARRLYRDLEQELRVPLYRDLPCYRVFANAGERQHWRRRCTVVAFREFTGPVEPPGRLGGYINDDFGGFAIRGAGVLDTAVFITVMRRRFLELGCLRVGSYPGEAPPNGGGPIRWQDVEADEVVCCTGYRVGDESLWQDIPFQPTKGEILMVRIPGLPETLIVGRRLFLLPMGHSLFRVGATYNWSDLAPGVTRQARCDLEDRLRELLSSSFEVIDQQAGIRPITRRRTPVIGRHPEYPRVALFNGLGSKGVLSAPYYAAQLADHLVQGVALDPEVQIPTHCRSAA